MSFANQTTVASCGQNPVKLSRSVFDTSTDFRSSKKLRTNVHFLHIVCENFSQESRVGKLNIGGP